MPIKFRNIAYLIVAVPDPNDLFLEPTIDVVNEVNRHISADVLLTQQELVSKNMMYTGKHAGALLPLLLLFFKSNNYHLFTFEFVSRMVLSNKGKNHKKYS